MTEPNYERIASRLQRRLAESVLRYEGDIALLQEQVDTLREENEALKAAAEESVPEKKK